MGIFCSRLGDAASHPRLTELTLQNDDWSDLACLKLLPSMQSLHLCGGRVRDTALLSLQAWVSLRALRISGPRTVERLQSLRRVARTLHRIRAIDISTT